MAPARKQIERRLRESSDALIDAHTHVGIDPNLFDSGSFPYCQSGDDLAVRMAATKVDFACVFPFIYSEYFRRRDFRQGRFRRDPASESAFPYQKENQRQCLEIYEAFPQFAGRLLPFAMFDPLRKASEQAAFLAGLAARYPLFGLKTAGSYIQAPPQALLRGKGPLLRFAADHNLPFMFHTAVMPGDAWSNVFDILDVVKACPSVRFCLAHTCRFDRRALDMAAELPNCWVDFSAFNIHLRMARDNSPAVAGRKDRFAADYRDAAHARTMQKIAQAYPDTMIWGTDTPAHQWFSYFQDDSGEEIWMRLPCGPYREAEEFRKLPKAIRRRIGWANTLEFLFGK